ncbi:hypothetical protein AB0F72_19875 [Actinoplanes sp. NPDC023936]|uniref:hypothetical protein n=1 Tax=Actinoplanes sp. NPDC023936 TaxID=3154910 RepID=UPI0033D27A53
MRILSRPVPRVVAVLLIVLAALIVMPSRADAQVKGHTCRVIATEGNRQSVQCINFNVFLNSEGDLAVQALGESLCQDLLQDKVIRCAGIHQTVTVETSSTARTQVCGRAGGSQCPAGRLYGYSSGVYCLRTLTYSVKVRTVVDMPASGNQWIKTTEISMAGSTLCTLIG